MTYVSRIRFTKHAREKLEFLRNYGFEISENEVIEAVLNPVRLDKKNDQFFALKAMDAKYALRVYMKGEKTIYLSLPSIQ